MKPAKNRAVTGSGANLGGSQTTQQQAASRNALRKRMEQQNAELRAKQEAKEIDRHTGKVVPKYGEV